MSTEPIPVYGTAGGEPAAQEIPAYGTPEPQMSSLTHRPRASGRRSLIERATRGVRRLAWRLTAGVGDEGRDWSVYPGLTAGDSSEVLDGIRLDEVLARNDRILSRVRRALEVEFRVHWWSNTDTETLDVQFNSWGGASLLQSARSATWRTTSGLTSVEDRDMAARIVGVALTHEGFADQDLQRLDDEWILSARHAESPESVLTPHLGYSEFELTLDSSGVLPAEHETEFRIRAKPFTRRDA